MILRLPLQVKLYSHKDEVVQTINTSKKSQVRKRVQGFSRDAWTYGTCRVFYNKPNNFWNEFTFTSMAQFEAGLITVTEKPLIDFMRDLIPQQYLEKRKPSEAQRRSLARAQANSPLGARS